jgi:hypothetical protein
MATNLSILEFFTRIREEEDYEGPIIDKEAKLDLESYINNYTGDRQPDSHQSLRPCFSLLTRLGSQATHASTA